MRFMLRLPSEAAQYTRLDVASQRVRLAEQPALAEGNAEATERLQLFQRVETLADDARAEPLGKRLERAQQLLARGILVDAGHEGTVDLDELGRQLHHRFQARVARPGVVQRDLEAELAVGVAHLAEH